jgi:hypothetical protein
MTPGLGSECGVLNYPTSPKWVAMGTSTKISALETPRGEKAMVLIYLPKSVEYIAGRAVAEHRFVFVVTIQCKGIKMGSRNRANG